VVQCDLTKTKPVTAVKRFTITSKSNRFLSGGEIQRLLQESEKQVTSPWLLPPVTLALNTGMRQGELLATKWENVSFERAVVSILQSKTLRPKSQPADHGRLELAQGKPLRRLPVYVAVGR